MALKIRPILHSIRIGRKVTFTLHNQYKPDGDFAINNLGRCPSPKGVAKTSPLQIAANRQRTACSRDRHRTDQFHRYASKTNGTDGVSLSR